MIQAIMDGEFTLLYEQLIYTNRGEQLLESKITNSDSIMDKYSLLYSVAWELPNGPNGDSYRERYDDRYVVFHFHFDHLVDFEGTITLGSTQ